ncbi:ATP-binding protein [Sphaerisporangium album]|nr:ATP-binding protein [Sphaerisporangium album]
MADPTSLLHGLETAAPGSLLGVTELAASPESVALAREFVQKRLRHGHPALYDVTLLVSEVVTNAVMHSESKNTGTVAVAIAESHGRVRVEVIDAGGEIVLPAMVDSDEDDRFAEGGRGLMLVSLISEEWGTFRHEAGKTVWFEVIFKD